MKSIFRNILAALVLTTAAATSLSAQSGAATGYFTDGYAGRHLLNPALTPNYGYFGLPVLNSLTVNTASNLAADDIFFPTSKGLSLFLSPEVSAAQFMSCIDPMNSLNVSLNENLISMGFFNKKGTVFTSIDLGVRADVMGEISGDLFAFAKGADAIKGSGKTYDLSGTDLRAVAYAQLALGQSFSIENKVHIGYRAKFLLGAANAQAHFNKFTAQLDADKWVVDSDASILYNGVSFGTKSANGQEVLDFTKPNLDYKEIVSGVTKNLGFSFDLGFAYDITDWIQVSASLTDLGMILFNNVQMASSSSHISLGDEDGAQSIKEFGEQFSTIAQFKPQAGSTNIKKMLPATARAGLQVRVPFYKRVSVGALYTQKLHQGYYGWEARASVNYDLFRWFSLSASYAYNKPLMSMPYACNMIGGVANIHMKGLNIFVCADNIPLSYTAHGAPLSTACLTVNTGINFLFGQYNGRYSHKSKASKNAGSEE